ncbi:MAG: MFS transporter [Bacteroidota bacterium]|nr:MFS transporter [Candidatus Kapabacteria bacterium]MDW8220137.1 MFS transporter [Bacteroidota bacterium]
MREGSLSRKDNMQNIAVSPNKFPPEQQGWYAIAVLLLAYISSMIDRVILGYLVTPIKQTFEVTDSHLSVLMGIAFTLFYTCLGIFAGHLADTSVRRTIIAGGIALWSLATVYCGMAKSYFQLFLGRVAVGIGEATLSPSAYSLIADYFPPERRTTAMSVYSMGISIGNGAAVMLAGAIAGFAAQAEMMTIPLVGAIYPWQYIFFVVGLPGLLVSLLCFTVKEPPRIGIDNTRSGNIRSVLRYIQEHKKAALCHTLGFSMFSVFNQGVGFWFPELFIRTYGWKRPEIGLWQGSTSVLFGTIGLWVGSRLAEWFLRRGYTDANMRVMLVAAAGLLPIAVVMPLLPTGTMAACCFVWTALFGFMPYGAAPAAIQQLMPNQMRGQAGALFLFTINVIGGGAGPFVVSSLTDFVFNNDAALRYSVAVTALLSLSAALILYAYGLRYFRESMRRVASATMMET